MLQLCQQHAVGHELDERIAGAVILKAYFAANLLTPG